MNGETVAAGERRLSVPQVTPATPVIYVNYINKANT